MLQDDRPLYTYVHKDWTTLRLKVTTKWTFGPGSVSRNPIDLTGKGKPTIDWEGRKPIAPRKLPVPTIAQLHAVRKEALENGAEPMVTERFQQLAMNGARLMAVSHVPSRGSAPGRARGALEMLMELEDYEEDVLGEFDPAELHERQLRHRKSEPSKSEYDLIPPPGSSPMADIYYRLQNPRNFRDSKPIPGDVFSTQFDDGSEE